MKFPRQATIFRRQLDAAPFAAMFFLLVLFMMLASLVYTPGARLELRLPEGAGLPGADRPSVSVAIDADGRLYYENQWIQEDELRRRLQAAVAKAGEPLTLIVQADKAVSYERCLRLALLAREAGMTDALLATLPGPYAVPPLRSPP
ncbi:MAG TPA: biopolymer transporter ExbD [Verrucomicrobiota bacterium]|jgi:biopolymer transport protein ExbD|nr:biopolymer transporter ExbD [Verrucomicrobiota bacterium]OQC26580.1 MAG: biopolymer transport protein ExbD [Verrucomicrobia bacterium ADurb.Bin063]HRR63815.1 biopolymer transporter ExbD [Candidatus Paceibacterota bacterium]MBP8014498.1 biopolymer transporter ExbD [Verrucomicrobiota bacterium]MDI9373791.1 biopolymer transporter ExbD [Verrucomicrobiota bacterium]